MARVSYHPGTSAGNITLLEWDANPSGKELRHAS